MGEISLLSGYYETRGPPDAYTYIYIYVHEQTPAEAHVSNQADKKAHKPNALARRTTGEIDCKSRRGHNEFNGPIRAPAHRGKSLGWTMAN